MNNLTWKEVLNSNYQLAGVHISEFLPIVKKSRYEYFSWNGEVYKFEERYLKLNFYNELSWNLLKSNRVCSVNEVE